MALNIIMWVWWRGLVCAVKIFLCVSGWFLFVFWSLLLVLYVVLGAVDVRLGAVSCCLGCVLAQFHVVRSHGLGGLGGFAGREISKEEGGLRLMSSSTVLDCDRFFELKR